MITREIGEGGFNSKGHGEGFFVGEDLENHVANALLTFAHGMYEDEATRLLCDERFVELYRTGDLEREDFMDYMEARRIVIKEIILWDDGHIDFAVEFFGELEPSFDMEI